MIKREIIEKVRERADIVEVISRYIPLKPAGKNYRALCPFHKEKTPSFTVSPEKGLFHCFGCGVGGNVFTFLMRYEGISFYEAVKSLAERYGIPIEEVEGVQEKLEPYFEINRMANEIFRMKLLHPREGKVARDYLLKRGVAPKSWELYGLGYAPDQWDLLSGFFEQKGKDLLLVEEVGLIIRGTKGYYDRFRGRIIFPIEDIRGRILGFGGRILGEGEPKYLNSPDSPIFKKGECLYGLKQARDHIIQKREAVIVEGYFDVISLAQSGLRNVVAPLGTALTEVQLRILKPLVNKVLLLFDGDQAGRKAAMRAVELLVQEGIEGDIIILPENEDPDTFLKSHSVEDLLRLRKGGLEFYCEGVINNYEIKKPEGKFKAAQAFLEFLSKVEDPLKRKIYGEYISSLLGIEPDLLLARLKTTVNRNLERRGFLSAEEVLVALSMQYEEILTWLEEEGILEEFSSEILRDILKEAIQVKKRGGDPSVEIPVMLQERGGGGGIFSFLLSEELDNPQKVFRDCVKRIRLRALRKRRERLLEEIMEAERRGDEEKLRMLLLQQQAFLKQERALLESLR
jgi:DNA primase